MPLNTLLSDECLEVRLKRSFASIITPLILHRAGVEDTTPGKADAAVAVIFDIAEGVIPGDTASDVDVGVPELWITVTHRPLLAVAKGRRTFLCVLGDDDHHLDILIVGVHGFVDGVRNERRASPSPPGGGDQPQRLFR